MPASSRLRFSPWLLLAAAAALLLLLPARVFAQGRIIPRPCAPPVPPPCRGDCIVPVVECRNTIERIASDVQAYLDDRGRVLRYEITETFVHRGHGLGEADYVFPLPAGAAFEDLRLEINGELVAGETLDADKARRIYEDIVRRQRDPALVEWMGHGLLRARIFPLNPGEEKKVVVRFRSVARREGSALRIDYARGSDPSGANTPRVVNVRERDGDERTRDWSRFTLSVPRSADLGTAYSPTHTLRERERGGRRVITASGTARTVTILLPLRRPDAAAISLLAHAPQREAAFALITVSPPPARTRTLPRDVTFVLDVSGSMRGDKLEQARAAGRRLLESLRPQDRFRVIAFSTDVNPFRDDFLPATSGNVRDARRFIESLRAEGSTNISAALEEALRDGDGTRERLPLVVFVTDGEPTVGERNPDAISAMAARQRGDTRVFTVGVGAEIHTSLIEQLALQGRGTAHFVAAHESVEHTVDLLSQRLAHAVLSNVRVRAEGVRLLHVHPALPVDLFAGQDLVLLARYEGSGPARIRVQADAADGPVMWDQRAEFPARENDNAFVARLWATQRIGWLAAEKRRLGGSSELDAEIRSLGERYGIPTEFSSYLVLEPGMQVADGLRRDAQRSALPASVRPQAASGAMAAKERDFAAARQAAALRETRNLAQADEAVGQVGGVRQVEHRIFREAGGVWTDSRYTPSMRIIRVKAYSTLYFDLVRDLPGLATALTLGDRVIVAGRTVAIEIGPVGDETLRPDELQSLKAAWGS